MNCGLQLINYNNTRSHHFTLHIFSVHSDTSNTSLLKALLVTIHRDLWEIKTLLLQYLMTIAPRPIATIATMKKLNQIKLHKCFIHIQAFTQSWYFKAKCLLYHKPREGVFFSMLQRFFMQVGNGLQISWNKKECFGYITFTL